MHGEEILEAFENGTLTPGQFHHQDHILLAWTYLQRWPLLEVLPRFSSGLQRFARRVGAADLYHETITWAFLFLIHDRIERQGRGLGWEEFRQQNQDLITAGKDLLHEYYLPETLQSELARRTFVFPDLDRSPPVERQEIPS